MKFGLHYLLSVSESQSPSQRYRDTLEQAVRAEGLGFESVWPVEQHFNQMQSALPCPTLLLAAIAARTTTLRLGTAIVQLPLAHPLRTAEEIATLDVLSGGRVEFGVGRGSQPKHFAGFGVPPSESRDRMVEALDYLRVAFTHDRFSFDGRFFRADDICLVPKPVQRPHPPIRIAANGPDSFELAGRLGYPILVATHINPLPKLRELLVIYHSARAAAGHPAAMPDDLTILTPFYVGDSAARVRQDAEPAVEQFVRVASSLLTSSAGDWASPAEGARMNALLERLRATTFDTINTEMGIFDTPDGCVERIRQIEGEFGPGRMICWFNFFGAIPHHRVLDSMELFSAKVLPDVWVPFFLDHHADRPDAAGSGNEWRGSSALPLQRRQAAKLRGKVQPGTALPAPDRYRCLQATQHAQQPRQVQPPAAPLAFGKPLGRPGMPARGLSRSRAPTALPHEARPRQDARASRAGRACRGLLSGWGWGRSGRGRT